MGILRTDRVSGLGGANAIKGSTKFDGDLNYQGNYLSTEDSNDFNLGSGDFTIEAWIYASALSSNNFEGIIGQWPASGANANNSWVLEIVAGDLEFYYCYDGANLVGPIQGGTVKENEWTHVMATRSGNTMYMFINGTAHNNSGQSVTHTFNDSAYDVTIGGYIATAAMWNGNISNVRVIKGTALHTSNFTVPTNELVKTSDTVLLACQSSADILKEATGKIITPRRNNVNSSYPTATKFTPNSPVGFSTTTDVGTQFGSTFDGVTTFDSQAYMVPPGGNTRERNRGRMILFGGGSPGRTDNIDSLELTTLGNAVDFGSLSAAVFGGGATASSTRGVFWMGEATYTTLEFVTISNSSNTTTFGTGTSNNGGYGFGNQTRGIWALGTKNILEFVTIATTGNTTDFGDQTLVSGNPINEPVAFASPTRGVIAGGYGNNPYPQSDVIEFVTIATTGNATDFGDLTQARSSSNGLSNSTRGIIAGGYTFPGTTTYYNIIEFVTIATTGNATDFGDAVELKRAGYNGSTPTRGVFAAGTPATSATNSIEFITIATTGNAQDFGDTRNPQRSGSGCSDSHGGLE